MNKKVKEIIIPWYGHVMRMEEDDPVREAIGLQLEGKRPKRKAKEEMEK